MKIGAMDQMWSDLPFEARLDRISKLGFEGFQAWFLTAELGFAIPHSWFRGIEVKRLKLSPNQLRRITQNLGLEIACFGPHYIMGHHPPTYIEHGLSEFKNEEEKRNRIKDIKKLIEFSYDSGVNIVVLFSGGDPAKKVYWSQLVDMVRILVDHAEKFGMILAIENMPQLLVNDEDALLKLINDVGSKYLKVNFDPKNLNYMNRDIPQAVRKLKGHICLTHGGDSLSGAKEFTTRVIGKGTVPYLEYLTALKEIEYDGWIIIEYGGDERGIEPGIVESKQNLEHFISKVWKGVY